ncbi:MAG: penicillin-binding protein [Candidatus Limimorpha sp.]
MKKIDFPNVWRPLLVYSVFLFVGIAIVVSIIVIQISGPEKISNNSVTSLYKIYDVPAVRGTIFSKNGEVLATSTYMFDVFFDPVDVKDEVFDSQVGALADSLSKMIGMYSKSQYKKIFVNARANNKRYIPIATKLRKEEYERLMNFPIFREESRNGTITNRHEVRERPYGDMAMRTIGYVKYDKSNPILVGLEGAYDTCLSGKNGVQMRRYVNGGSYIDVPAMVNEPPQNGKDVYTSIDVKKQDIVEEALRNCLKENVAEQGCVVLMDVQSGFVEAIASLRYDSIKKSYEESYNFAIGHSFEPGSTFKAVTMTALLENNPDLNVKKVLDLGTTGSKKFYNRVMKDSHVVANGKPTIEQAFWESSNIAFATLVQEYFGSDPQKFIDLIYKTKINQPLDLCIKGEGKPNIKSTDSKYWSKLSLPWMSIGYEVALSPISILTYYNAIANNGVMVKPQFVKEIRKGNEVVAAFDTIVINESIASEHTITTLQGLLRGVVEKGTAKLLNDCAFSVAGKTGTAQISVNGKYNKRNYTASFVGYFPADNPKYSCIVVVCNPGGKKYYGASVSAPVFKDIAEKVFATELGIEDVQIYPANCDKYTHASMALCSDVLDYCEMSGVRVADSELTTEWVNVEPSINGGVRINNIELQDGVVPDLSGMNVTDAVYLLESMGWKTSFSGRGTVSSQSVKAGTELAIGKSISLKLK